MQIRSSLLGGAALGALIASSLAVSADAQPRHHRPVAAAVGVAVNHDDADLKSEVATLQQDVQALKARQDQEDSDNQQLRGQVQTLQGQLADANARASQAEAQVQAQIQTIPGDVKAEVAKAAPKPGWWANTSVSGRMYYDLTDISETSDASNGLTFPAPTGHSANGVNFDIKRFYVSIDHTFNDVFSADITTDFNYDSGAAGATQLYIKKAYLQAKLSDAFIVRLGSADMPWIPFDEDTYGYRYVENTLIDRTKFGTSADWGVHVLGKVPVGPVSIGYQASVVNGMGYKKPGFIGGVNRSEGMDFEGRLNLNYQGFTAAVGGYTGKLGQDFAGVTTFHTAERFDALVAYSDKLFRIGGEYMWARADVAASQITLNGTPDDSEGWSIFGNINVTPQVAIFGRADWVKPRETTQPLLVNNYYNVGVSWEPVKIVDFALVYKHDAIDHGAFGDQNFATAASNGHATYDEVGLWGQFRW